jgi:dynein heavy chain 1
VQQHLRKMFSGIQQLDVKSEGDITILTAIKSPEDEDVPLQTPVTLGQDQANIWLAKIEDAMRVSLKAYFEKGVHNLRSLDLGESVNRKHQEDQPVVTWVDSLPAQCMLLSLQVMLCERVETALSNGQNMDTVGVLCKSLLQMLAETVLSPMQPLRRRKLEHMIAELVHHETVVDTLIKSKVASARDFSWLFFMRYYARQDGLRVSVANADFKYDFEYHGAADRIVQTPLTDRVYLTLTQALSSRMGGSPFGPAGTGKTETVKALAAQLGKLVLVFNCDESFDLHSMGRIFLGLCQTGAWGCFDEFNRLEERILSAVSQQILTIQTAVRQGLRQVELIGRTLPLNDGIGIFVTMNPNYAGRSNLPDNLKQLFRSVAMSKPDSELIAQITLYSQGFRTARELAAKVVPLFKLCTDQLSPCSHYDFGLRALKAVLVGAGVMKQRAMMDDETILVCKSFCNSVVPKLVPSDIPLLQALLVDVFPGTPVPAFQDELLRAEILALCKQLHFAPSEIFVNKIVQLKTISEIHHVRKPVCMYPRL